MKDIFINSRNKMTGIYSGGILNFANQKTNIRNSRRPNPFIFSMKGYNTSNPVHVASSPIIVNTREPIINKEKIIINKKSKATNIREKINKLVSRKPSISHRGEGFLIKE